MKRSDINQPPCYFDKYIVCIDDLELLEAFQQSQTDLDNLDLKSFHQIGDAVYAQDKWTIKDILQHLIDAEHILSYRSLRIARNDQTELPGFDEILLAAHVNTKTRNLESLVEELKLLRKTTEYLFRSFDDQAMHRSLVVGGNRMSALAYGFAILGHQKYHLKIITDRYLPLLNNHASANSN